MDAHLALDENTRVALSHELSSKDKNKKDVEEEMNEVILLYRHDHVIVGNAIAMNTIHTTHTEHERAHGTSRSEGACGIHKIIGLYAIYYIYILYIHT